MRDTRGLRLWAWLVGAAAVAAAAIPATAVARARRHRAPTVITVASGRADLISGGSALVQVLLPPRATRWRPQIRVGSRNVTRELTLRRSRVLEGLITGLPVGRSTLTVRLRDHTGARITLTNHRISGPVFSGPQIQPWRCQATARDPQCNQPIQFSYVYQSTDPTKTGFQPYDPAHPPADVATTTTDTGATVPFIVRLETGYEDRDQYKVATLFAPGRPWSWSSPQPQWNHKLLITHGASCDIDYGAGSAPSVTAYDPADDLGLPLSLSTAGFGDSAHYALAHGFAVMSTALDNNGHNCDVVTQAESLVMAKEHVVKSYGPLQYTIGAGCSGGSLAQQWIANAYPGIYQGILPTCSFPDTWSTATQVFDYHVLRAYFEHPLQWGPGVLWLPTQFGAVEGNPLPLNAVVSDVGFFNAIVPTHACGGITDAQRYQPQTNPGGVRCSVADYAINVFGPQPPGDWNAIERRVRRGFAGVPVDNIGVQYGLSALRSGQIAPAQFVDLNTRIGGLDIDGNPTAQRTPGTTSALARAYRSGMINETNNLDRTPIIDCRGPDPGAAHDAYRAFTLRARLDREHRSHANQLIWEGPAPIIGDTECTVNTLIAMDRWLTALKRDPRRLPIARKIVADKPAGLTDECWDGHGHKLSDALCGQAVVPIYGTPRTVAGDGITTDANKCQLKPLRRSDYGVSFSDAEWSSLLHTFPQGVCDYSRPGVLQQPTIPWLTYSDARGRVVYGGLPLGPAPASHPLR